MNESSPPGRGTADLASVLAALEDTCSGGPEGARDRLVRGRRRRALTLVMMVLLIGGVIALVTVNPVAPPVADGGSRASVVFGNARSGTCLSWPPDAPDKPSFVQCRSQHVFEVVKPMDTNGFGEPCQLAVRDYLGPRYDPNSRFIANVLWAREDDGGSGGEGNPLCGLQLPGPDGKPMPFEGRIADLDQSKVWPVGTCLGIDSSHHSTDLPVACTAPHALEVTGATNLADRFRGEPPKDADQRAFITEACTRAANAYLSPATLAQKRLVLGFDTISATSWSAGSKQVSCNVGRPADQGWTPVTGSVKTPSPADLPSPSATAPPAAPLPAPTRAPAPPPVYLEPLVPVPTELPASPEPTSSAAPGVPAAPGPLPGPATPPSETDAPPPGDVESPSPATQPAPAGDAPVAPAEPAPAPPQPQP